MDISSYLRLVPQPVALVTGANKGIGFEIARELAQGGCFVWLAGRELERVKGAAAKLESAGLKVGSVTLDVTDPESARAASRQVEAASGRLDILVNNAGISLEAQHEPGQPPRMIPPSELDLGLLRQTYETNVFGPVTVTQAFLPLVRKSAAGRIVNMSSGLGSLAQKADPSTFLSKVNVMAYCSSKNALNGVTVAFANELRETAIKVNAADPGYCATDLNGHSGPRSATEGAAIAVKLATLPATARPAVSSTTKAPCPGRFRRRQCPHEPEAGLEFTSRTTPSARGSYSLGLRVLSLS
ncbi:MAG: SDR family oxidoreductase [Verrucomicrobiota bacterium]